LQESGILIQTGALFTAVLGSRFSNGLPEYRRSPEMTVHAADRHTQQTVR